MKTYKVQLGARRLIKTAANYHSITAKQLLKLYSNAVLAPNLDTARRAFIIHLLTIQKALEAGKQVDLLVEELCNSDTGIEALFGFASKEEQFSSYELSDPRLHAHTYLFDTIHFVYKTGAVGFDTLPKIKPIVTKIETVVAPTPPPNVVDPIVVDEVEEEPIQWNEQQKKAFKEVYAWLRTPNRKPIFRLYGYAGTGKTVMSKEIARFVMAEGGKRNVPMGSVVFSAYTGKACSVLRSKGCYNADTLHSYIYTPLIDPETGIVLSSSVNRSTTPFCTAALIIVDECSMVNNEIAADLLSYGVPILVLGDPEQLPPVSGEGSLTDAEPDVLLTDVRRQAKDNPIIYLSMLARNREIIKPGNYGDSVVYSFGTHLTTADMLEHDQTLVGKRNTRTTMNRKIRKAKGLFEKSPFYPIAGDRLICIHNNKTAGLYNGTLWDVEDPSFEKAMQPIRKGSPICRATDLDVIKFTAVGVDEFEPGTTVRKRVATQVSLHMFNETLDIPSYRELAGTDKYEYGNAITVHKSQASQWDSVLLYDESQAFREHAHRHLYTGITRAAKKVSIYLGN